MRHSIGILPAVVAMAVSGAATASPVLVMFESDEDLPAGASELAILSYDSIADVVSNSPLASVFTDFGVAQGFSSTGITRDGSDFLVMFESDEDLPAGASELAILSYHTIADIVANSPFASVFTEFGVAQGFSSTGITRDGSDFHVLFESDEDLPAGASELALLSYHSLADVVSNSPFASVFTDFGVAQGFSSTGITRDGSDFLVMFESDEDLPAGASELAILSYHTIADIVSNSPFASVFTEFGVAQSFSSTGISFGTGPTLAPIPVPPSLPLLAVGGLLLCLPAAAGGRAKMRHRPIRT